MGGSDELILSHWVVEGQSGGLCGGDTVCGAWGVKMRARLCRTGKASLEKGALRLQMPHTG